MQSETLSLNYSRILEASRAEREELLECLMEEEKRACEKSYYEFIRVAWWIMEPETPFIDNWHIKYLCDLLQYEIERIAKREPKYRDYIVNIPPRSMKSIICTVQLCPWAWINYPHIKFINNSHNKELSTKHCLESRRIIDSEWYQMYWGDRYKLSSDQNVKGWFENDHGGMRKATSTGAGIYGAGADIITNDDPQDPEKSESDTERETVKRHYGGTLYSRLNDQEVGLRINIQQRLHEDDLTGHLMALNPERYTHVCIPAVVTDDVSPRELRKFYNKDGLFFPKRFPWHVLEAIKLPSNLGSTGYACQYLQSPSPPEGGTFKRYWWRFWRYPGMELPPVMQKNEKGDTVKCHCIELPTKFEKVIDSWDTALDGEITRDDVAGGKWGKVNANKFLLNQLKGKYDYVETKKAVLKLYRENVATSAVVIEKSSNGPAVKADLQGEIPGIITKATGKLSKEDRAKISDTVPYAAQVEAGNVYLPHPHIAPWVQDFIDEHAKFPKSAQDAQVDQATQAINHLTTAKYIWNYYLPMDGRHFRAFDINWRHYINIGAIHLSKSLKMTVLTALWSRIDRKLYIYGELILKNAPVDRVAYAMFRGMQMMTRKTHRIVGNELMFDLDKRSTANLLQAEFRRVCKAQKIYRYPNIRQPYLYDRNGSINLCNLMFSRDEIIVHSMCQSASKQISGWCEENGKPVEDGFELCECLTMMVSELNRMEKIKFAPPPVDGYRPIKEKPKENPEAWQMA